MFLPRVSLIAALSLGLESVVSAVPLSTNSSTSSACIPTPQASLPQDDCDPASRAAAIETKRDGFLYGPSLIGDASFFPAGSLGNATVAADLVPFTADQGAQEAACQADALTAITAISTSGDLSSLATYASGLYDGQWLTSVPGGEDAGLVSNYTQDLLFSMQRLSVNPYPLNRLSPSDTPPFTVNDSVVSALTTSDTTFDDLLASGNLFFVDHSYQAKYPTNGGLGRYGAACAALFFIHPETQDFMPLAIKTNVGSDLVYTPLDLADDWLLAKIMFNMNDLFHGEMYHLAASHDVAEIVHEAAKRTLSDTHPVMVLLDRLMYQAYAIRSFGAEELFEAGGSFDGIFYINSTGAKDFITDFYPTAGAFQANYLETDLESRGLLNPSVGTALKSFPFYSDTSSLRATIQTFMTSFVASYYPDDSTVAADTEVQAWVVEANGPAEAIDFPSSITTTAALVDVLTHFAYLTGVAHHVLNTGDSVAAIGVLPLSPAALYQPIPTAKGVTDVVSFLPPASQAVAQVALLAAFNRFNLDTTERTLEYAYSNATFLSVFNADVTTAAATYLSSMQGISATMSARTFDSDGLSEGMPFIWKGLDPGVIPFYFAI